MVVNIRNIYNHSNDVRPQRRWSSSNVIVFACMCGTSPEDLLIFCELIPVSDLKWLRCFPTIPFLYLSSHGEQEQISLRTFNFLLESWAKMKNKTERNWFRFGYPMRERCQIIAKHSCSCWLLARMVKLEKTSNWNNSWKNIKLDHLGKDGQIKHVCSGVIPIECDPTFPWRGQKKRVMTAPVEAVSSHYLRRTSAVVWPSLTWRIIPFSKWLVTPIYKPWNGHLEGE